MTPDRLPNAGQTAPGIAHWRELWFAGLTWKGLALIVLMCLLNALRRNSDAVGGPVDIWLTWVVVNFGTGLIVALLVALAVVATYNRVPSVPRLRYPALGLAVLISSALGTMILFAVESRGTFDLPQHWGGLAWSVVGTWPRYALLGLMLAAVFVHVRIADESEAARHRAELDRALFDQQMDEARLQVLQAQIEPHFLFNTLATVRRLYQTQPAAAESMLENLMRYLAVALPQMRATDSTLGREAALAEAYLGIQQIRMGRRLGFAIEVPGALREASLPPMMLLTLIENAIKHGLNPLREGGFIHISARVDRDRLDLRVADSGQGFTKTSGGGTGLANIRARLAALYGPAAQLRLEASHPRGVTATIALPYTTAVPAATLV